MKATLFFVAGVFICIHPAKANPKSAVSYYKYYGWPANVGTPIEKLWQMIHSSKTRFYRISYENIDTASRKSDVLYDGQRKELTYYEIRGDHESTYYRFYAVDTKRLYAVIKMVKRENRRHNLGTEPLLFLNSLMYIDVLAKVGCSVRDLRSGKWVTYENLQGIS